MRSVRTPVVLLLALAAALSARPARAQEVARVYVMTPAPGQGAAFERALTAHAQWRKQAGDPWNWTVYQVVDGAELGSFIVRSAGHTWADLDAYDAGFGPTGGARFEADVGPLLARMTSSITTEDTSLARWPADFSKIQLVQVTRFHVKAERGQAFHATIQKAHQALVKANWPGYYAFASTVSGENGQDVIMATFHTSWADFAEPDPDFMQVLTAAYGKDQAAALMQSLDDSLWGWDSMVLRARPDMSVMHGSM